MKNKKVIITGILGQDGANMAEFLLKNTDHEIYGMMRRSSNPNFINAKAFKDNPRFKFVFGDLGDEVSLDSLVKEIQPDYFINFAANSFVGISWNMPLQVFDKNTLGVIRSLEAIRKFKPDCRFYSAGSSEEWGDVEYSPQNINHPIKPRSPYGASKAAARHLIKVYRESYGMYAVHGILFNHEGTKRGEEFVTRKISKGVANIYHSLKAGDLNFNPISLGNLHSKRDWSDSEDFVEGVWLMLNQPTPKEYILSSNKTHSVKEFVERAFSAARIMGCWLNEDNPEKMVYAMPVLDDVEYAALVVVDPALYRPAEVDLLWGDSSPIRSELGWSPKSSFGDLVKKMVEYDIKNFS